MKKLNQTGAVDAWLVAFILTTVLLLGSLGFGFSMFSSREDYKNNVDEKIAKAVEVAEAQLSEKKEAEFLEREKEPLTSYTGPAAYGSLSIGYPKTWSAYINESGGSSVPLDGYLNPVFVPNVQNNKANVALHFQVMDTSYTQVTRALESQVKAGKIRTAAFSAPKVPGTVGIRVDGEVVTGKSGSMIILPLRDKTLKVWTESPQFVEDFNNIVIPNLNFVP